MAPFSNVSDKALRDFAQRVLLSEKDKLSPLTTELEIAYFVKQLTSYQLTQIYGMFYRTGMVQ